jgi:hypothetical protein
MATSLVVAAEAEEQLRQFIWREDAIGAHEYICSLEPSLKTEPIFTGAAASTYMHFGHFERAAAIIEHSTLKELVSESGWILKEDVAWLALIAAQGEAQREFKFEDLISLLNEIEDIYIDLNCW